MLYDYGEKYIGLASMLNRHDIISGSDVLKALDKEKLGKDDLTLEDYRMIVGAHINSMNEIISERLGRPITPYHTSQGFADSMDNWKFMRTYFFLGGANFYTKNFGRYIAFSNIEMNLAKGLMENKIDIYDIRLVDPLKDICDRFSEARGLKCISVNKEANIGSNLWYSR